MIEMARLYLDRFLQNSSDMSDILCAREIVFDYAVSCALGMYVLAAADIDCGVLHRSVTITVEADDIAALDIVLGNLFALLGLRCSAVRQRDIVVILEAVHNES